MRTHSEWRKAFGIMAKLFIPRNHLSIFFSFTCAHFAQIVLSQNAPSSLFSCISVHLQKTGGMACLTSLPFSFLHQLTLSNRRIPSPLQGKINQMPIRLIALDIDGTLLDSSWQLSDANRAAVAKATGRGIEVALVTGRRYDFAMPVAQQLDCPLTMIVNNGALIRTADGKTHLRHLLTQDTARSVLLSTKTWREGAAVIFDRPVENQIMLESLREDDSIRYAYYKRNLAHIGIVSPLENSLTEDPIQVMFSGTVTEMRAAESILRNADFASGYRLAFTIYDTRDFAMIDVLPANCTKGSSLAEWAARQGLQRGEILAVGDNHN